MKIISNTPVTSVPKESSANGLNQLTDGVREPGGALPVATRTRATTAKITSMTNSMVSRTRWTAAEISRPRTQR